MLAIVMITRALADIKRAPERKVSGAARRARLDAASGYRWLRDGVSDGPLSLKWCCELIGLDITIVQAEGIPWRGQYSNGAECVHGGTGHWREYRAARRSAGAVNRCAPRPRPTVARLCTHCGIVFEGAPNRKFCGSACCGAYRRQAREQRNCDYCGKGFEVVRSRPRHFCGRWCAISHSRSRKIATLAPVPASLGASCAAGDGPGPPTPQNAAIEPVSP
jgi:hypothetical protein